MTCCIQCGAPVVILFTNVECPTFGCRNYSVKTAHENISNLFQDPRYKSDYESDITLGQFYCDESYIHYDLWWDPYNDVIKARHGRKEDDQHWMTVSDILKDFSFDDSYRPLAVGAERAIKYFRGDSYEKPTT